MSSEDLGRNLGKALAKGLVGMANRAQKNHERNERDFNRASERAENMTNERLFEGKDDTWNSPGTRAAYAKELKKRGY